MTNWVKIVCVILLMSGLSAGSNHGAAQEESAKEEAKPLEYVVRFDRHKQHYVDVQLTLDVKGRDSVDLLMATWTPGSYLIREYSRQIDKFEAEDGKGESLPVTKTAKNRWTIACEGKDKVVVRYDLYCREMSVRTNFVDAEYGVLNGASTFITQADRMDAPHHITIELPTGWKRAVTPLPQLDGGKGNQFAGRDFDHVVDSPIMVGNPSVYPFMVNGIEHLLVNLGNDDAWNGAQAAVDIQKIVTEHQRMWGTVPYTRYMFLNWLAESGMGGLEHDESTLIQSSRWTYHRSSMYRVWLGVVSHEYFHAWNVRTLRPKVLVDYDYEAENYFPSLWIAEGITSYYDNLALVRSGIYSESEYLGRLSGTIAGVQGTPGRRIQSLADSSHDAWIKFYRDDEMSRNTEISYYTKGSVVAFLLDMKIRELTNGEKSLDDVMRTVYERHSGDVGYEESEFRAVASEIAGQDLTEWFASAIDSTQELDYAPALEYLGLQIPAVTAAEREEDGDEEDDAAGPARPSRFGGFQSSSLWFGANTREGNEVSSVEIDSPAYQAGINVGDELIAFDQERLSSGGYSRSLDLYKAGDTVEVLIARRGRLMTIPVTLEASQSSNWRLSKVRNASYEQKARLADWLRQEPPKKEAEGEAGGSDEGASESAEENDASRDTDRPQRGGRGGRGGGGGGGGRLVEALKASDANGDGKIQKDEVDGPLARLFERFDANGDGEIDAEELAAIGQRGGRRGGNAGGDGGNTDSDGGEPNSSDAGDKKPNESTANDDTSKDASGGDKPSKDEGEI